MLADLSAILLVVVWVGWDVWLLNCVRDSWGGLAGAGGERLSLRGAGEDLDKETLDKGLEV